MLSQFDAHFGMFGVKPGVSSTRVLVTFICVLGTLRIQIHDQYCNSTQYRRGLTRATARTGACLAPASTRKHSRGTVSLDVPSVAPYRLYFAVHSLSHLLLSFFILHPLPYLTGGYRLYFAVHSLSHLLLLPPSTLPYRWSRLLQTLLRTLPLALPPATQDFTRLSADE
jgi:hypothetical protein